MLYLFCCGRHLSCNVDVSTFSCFEDNLLWTYLSHLEHTVYNCVTSDREQARSGLNRTRETHCILGADIAQDDADYRVYTKIRLGFWLRLSYKSQIIFYWKLTSVASFWKHFCMISESWYIDMTCFNKKKLQR